MKKVKLQWLKLEAFKGVSAFTFTPMENSRTIYGFNGTGKTTLADAMAWLFSGKDSVNSSDFEIKTLDESRKAIPMIDHTVEAKMSVDGKPLTLKKTFREKWVTKRGSDKAKFEGHETLHFIDDVPLSQKEYGERLEEAIGKVEAIQILTSVHHFNERLSWQERRKILLAVCGDVTDSDVIASDPKFKPIPGFLAGKTIEDWTKMVRATRKKSAEEMDEIPSRISQSQKNKPEEALCCPPQGKLSYKEIENQLHLKVSEKAGMLAGDTTTLRVKIAEKKELASKMADDYRKIIHAANMTKAECERSVMELDFQVRTKRERLSSYMDKVEELKAQREAKLAEYRSIKAETVSDEQVCPTCGRPATEEQANAAKAKFMESKASRIEQNKQQGKKIAGEIEGMLKGIDSLKAEIAQTEKLKAEAEANVSAVIYPDEPDMSTVNAEIAELEWWIGEVATPDTTKLDTEIAELREQIRQHNEAAANRKTADQIDLQIADLKKRQKLLAQEVDDIDAKLILIDQFIKAKMDLLTESVNKRFAPFAFQLFEEQINGGYRTTCEMLVPTPAGAMVPYGSNANTGHQMRAGLKVIAVLSEHYGISMPCFIDNANNLTGEAEDMPEQVFRLVASEEHATLTVEAA